MRYALGFHLYKCLHAGDNEEVGSMSHATLYRKDMPNSYNSLITFITSFTDYICKEEIENKVKNENSVCDR